MTLIEEPKKTPASSAPPGMDAMAADKDQPSSTQGDESAVAIQNGREQQAQPTIDQPSANATTDAADEGQTGATLPAPDEGQTGATLPAANDGENTPVDHQSPDQPGDEQPPAAPPAAE